MSYRKATLRRMPPTTRSLGRIINELQSATNRLQHLLEKTRGLEVEAILQDAEKKGTEDARSSRNV